MIVYDNYNISEDGVLTNRKGHEIKAYLKQGYKYAVIRYRGTNVNKAIHRIVAEAFIPNPDGKPQVNHKDGNKLNNTVSNLEWVTAKENTRHSVYVLKRDHQKGLRHPVRLVETGQEFDSRVACADFLHTGIDYLIDVCDDPFKTCKGYHIESVDPNHISNPLVKECRRLKDLLTKAQERIKELEVSNERFLR